jgi:hypothetical protein
MGTRGKLAGLVALTSLSAAAACKPLQLDLAVSEGGPADPPVIACASDGPCANTGTPFCDEDAGVCVECLASDVCPKNRRHCVMGVCVSCTQDSDCNDGGTGSRYCNTLIPRCASRCTVQNMSPCLHSMDSSIPEECAASDGLPYCVECTMDGDNASECRSHVGGTHCFGLPIGACGCQEDSDCPDGGRCGAPIGPSHLQFCAPPALIF